MSAHDRPLIMSAPMVRAILAGSKTQTRRVVTPGTSILGSSRWPLLDLDDPRNFVDNGGEANPFCAQTQAQYLHVWTADKSEDETCHRVYPRVVPGDRLWVRETWRTGEDTGPRDLVAVDRSEIHYRADLDEPPAPGCWRPSIFMPRRFSRLTLRATSVRVERLHDIDEGDAIAEGVSGGPMQTPREAYADLWDAINNKRAPWSSNPWVWIYTFRRIKEPHV